jgi:ABC-type nitrate/sulfonate/bicarbonate transport system substrate-binding protein
MEDELSIIQDVEENTMPQNPLKELWYTRCGIPTAIGLAVQLGWLDRAFAPLGITIRSLREAPDPKTRRSHFDHHLQYSVRQGGSSPALWAKSEGVDTRAIGLIRTDESQLILALPGSKIQTVKDLKGRRLALPKRQAADLPGLDVRGAAALRGYLSALSTEGLGHKDVEFVELTRNADDGSNDLSARGSFAYSFGDEVRALLDGRVDAIFVKDSRGQAVSAFLNAVQVIDLGSHPDPHVRINYGWPRPLTIDGALLREYPDVVERLLAVLIEAGEWAIEHPKETLELTAREVRMPEAFVAAGHPNLHERLVTDLDSDWIGWLTEYKDFLLQWGYIRNDFDVASWIDWKPLEAVKARGRAERRRLLIEAAE